MKYFIHSANFRQIFLNVIKLVSNDNYFIVSRSSSHNCRLGYSPWGKEINLFCVARDRTKINA